MRLTLRSPEPTIPAMIRTSRLRRAVRACSGTALVVLGASAWPAPAVGQATSQGPDSAQVVTVHPRSPRAAVTEYLTIARRGEFDEAARYLGPEARGEAGAALARQLKAVLDKHLWVDLDRVSPNAEGDRTDGLPPDTDHLGVIPLSSGIREPVRLVQRPDGEVPAWVFAPQTVERIEAWYADLDDRWLRQRMPLALQQPGPFGIELWQWVSLALLLPVAGVLAWVIGRLTIGVLHRAARQTDTLLDDRILGRVRGPVTALWFVLLYRALVEIVGLSLGAMNLVGLVGRALSVAAVTWMMVRVTQALEEEVPSAAWASAKPALRALVPLIARVARILLIAIGAVTVVAQLGVDVLTVVAGLGIGGLALALSAQKTLEHVIGSVAIGMDQPIRVGDFVRVADVMGTVEEIGLRSTRLRTLDRSLVVIPNGQLADNRMENFGQRDRILLRTKIGVEYGTTVEQLERIRDGFRRVLEEHPLTWRETIIVRFESFGDFSLNVEVIAWIATTDMNEFRRVREEVYFGFMRVVREAGASFAFPTQTIHLVKGEG